MIFGSKNKICTLNTLSCRLYVVVFNPESPIMRGCHVKERNKSASPWSWLNTSKSRFELSMFFSLCFLSSVCCRSLYLCLYLCLCLSICNKGLCSVFTEHHRKYHMRKGWDTLQKSLIEFLQGLKSLLPSDPHWPL